VISKFCISLSKTSINDFISDPSLFEQYRQELKEAGAIKVNRGDIAALLEVSITEVYRWEKKIVPIKRIYARAYLAYLKKIHKKVLCGSRQYDYIRT